MCYLKILPSGVSSEPCRRSLVCWAVGRGAGGSCPQQLGGQAAFLWALGCWSPPGLPHSVCQQRPCWGAVVPLGRKPKAFLPDCPSIPLALSQKWSVGQLIFFPHVHFTIKILCK